MATEAGAAREVRERADLLAVVGESVALRRMGRNYVGLCPFHEEKTPSLNVSPDKGLWYCFGCRAGGDVFDFVMKSQAVTFPEALEWLAHRFGVALPERRSPMEEARRERLRRLERLLEVAAAHYARALEGPAGEAARRYLGGRGVRREVAAAFGLGFAPAGEGSVIAHLVAQGFAPAEMEEAGVAAAGGQDRMAGRLVFPIRTPQGKVVGFGGRLLGDGEPKYLNSPDTAVFHKRRLLFGHDLARPAIRRSGQAILVEGYLDCVMAHQHGFGETVASLGTAASPEALSQLRREGARVLVAYDADRPGQAALLEVLRRCDALDLEARAVRLTGGKDPDEVLRRRGGEAFRQALEAALPRVEYLLELGQPLLAHPQGKARVARQVLEAIREHPSPVAREAYLRRVAERLEVSEAALRAEMGRSTPRRGRSRSQEPPRDAPHKTEKIWHHTPNGGSGSREEALTALLLQHPEVAPEVAEEVEGLVDADLRRIAAAVVAGAGMEGLPPELRAKAAALALSGVPVERPLELAKDLVRRLRADRPRQAYAVLLRQVRELEAAGMPVPEELLERLNAQRAMLSTPIVPERRDKA
jgi:DNA primase